MIEFMQIIKGNLNEKLPLVIHALLFSSASVPDTFKYTQCHYFLLDFVCVTSRITPCRCFMAHISFAPKDGSRLDFYILSGDHAEMRRRQRGQHEPMKDCCTRVEKSRWQTGKTGQKRPTFVIYSCKMIKIQVLKCTTNVCLGHEQVKII